MNTSSKNLIDRVAFNPQRCSGRPCIRSMRIRVSDVIDLLASGANREKILAEYPYLESDDISAALQYPARQSDHLVLLAA